MPGNLCFDWRTGDSAAVDAAFAAAAHVVELDLDNHRIVTNPMEPRGVVGLLRSGERPLHGPCLEPEHSCDARPYRARAGCRRRVHVRFVAPDVGGGFGAKNFIYPEHVLILWAARRVGRPVKWIATRSEVFLADHQARDHAGRGALALDAEGRFLALRVDSVANVGAYLVERRRRVQTFQYVHLPGTVYRIPAIELQVAAVLTNTAPIGVTRGPGFAEAVNIIERLIDAAARQCGFDRAELRRINMVPAEAMPMTNAFGNHGRQRRLRRDLRPRAGGAPMSTGFAGAAPGERGARAAARPRLRLSHQGDRRLAARECRYPLRGRRHGVADHRHADDRPGPRDDLPADPRRPARPAERAHPARARATPT